ncbi:MAG: 1-acyl-sn-glycerol-3-phosphate acyltransferase [Verrucomicrobiae bacterium]|nr:1-acyl-sn-glycerol-3-phosphate acyltransferase [Verrucomicrobiae bacterium]
MKPNGKVLQYQATTVWQRLAGTIVYALFELCFWLFLWRWNRGTVHGTLPCSPVVITPNHSSYLDWLLLDVICRRKFGRHVTFLAKRKVVRNPLFAALARSRGAIVFDEASRTQAVSLTVKTLSRTNDNSPPAVCIFPEGTRSRTGEKYPLFCGAATLARKSNACIVPVALCGFWEVWPPHRKLPTLHRIGLSVHFLPPINPNGSEEDMTLVEDSINRAYAIVRRTRRERDGSQQ